MNSESYKRFTDSLDPAAMQDLTGELMMMSQNKDASKASSVGTHNIRSELDSLNVMQSQAQSSLDQVQSEIDQVNRILTTINTFMGTDYSPEVVTLKANLNSQLTLLLKEKTQSSLPQIIARQAELNTDSQTLQTNGQNAVKLLADAPVPFVVDLVGFSGHLSKTVPTVVTVNCSAVPRSGFVMVIVAFLSMVVRYPSTQISGQDIQFSIDLSNVSLPGVTSVQLKFEISDSQGRQGLVFANATLV